MPSQRLRGFRDIYAEEVRLFQEIETISRETFQLFQFEELRTPILEEKELFVKALGTETDVVQKEMYEFEDRSKTKVVMRPEGTAGVVRAYLENSFDKTQGFSKFYYIGPMFRSERPQAGRLRQFHQIGVEQLGTNSPYADAETIHCFTSFLDRLGVTGYELRLNNLGTFEERRLFKEKLKDFFLPHKNALCEDCKNRLDKNVFRILDCKIESCRKIIETSPPIQDFLAQESKDHYTKVCHALDEVGVKYKHDFYMVRGLDYYTKTVFEVSHPKLGAQDALGAGGRYDHLIESFGGSPSGAVGFAIGVERLLACIMSSEVKNETKEFCDTYFIVTLGENAQRYGFKLLSDLRAKGVSAAMDFESKSMKSQMRLADKNKSRYVVILGDDELQKEKFKLKDMKEGTQEEFELGGVLQFLSTERFF